MTLKFSLCVVLLIFIGEMKGQSCDLKVAKDIVDESSFWGPMFGRLAL